MASRRKIKLVGWLYAAMLSALVHAVAIAADAQSPTTQSLGVDPAQSAAVAAFISQALLKPQQVAPASSAALFANDASQTERTARSLAQSFPESQRAQMQRAYQSSMQVYRQLETKFGWQHSDVAGALAGYVVGNYMALTGAEVPDEQFVATANQLRRDPRLRAQLGGQSAPALRALYERSAMVGTFMALQQMQQKPTQLTAVQVRDMARANLQEVLRVSPERLRMTEQGLVVMAADIRPLDTTASGGKQAAGSASMRHGRLLYDPGAGRTPVRLEVRTGKTVELPRSELSSSYVRSPDFWYAGASAAKAQWVRVDGNDKVSFHDGNSLAVTGGFDITQLAGTDQPEFVGPVRMSPDSRFLLAYWRANYRTSDPQLVVMNRRGEVLESGAPLEYERASHAYAADWLPDGRYVYLAGRRIVIAKPSAGIVSTAALTLPANISTEGADLRSSPDGQRLLLTLASIIDGTSYGLLFTVKFDGTGLRQITRPSDRLLRSPIRMFHAGATWSPDGRWIAFAPRAINPGAISEYRGCTPVLVIPADSSNLPVDGINDPDAWKLRGADTADKDGVVADCGTIQLSWLP